MMFCGSAAAHGGKPSAYRSARKTVGRLRLQIGRHRLNQFRELTESQRLSAMCCGEAAKDATRKVPF